jgi:hypothetical protein
MFDRSRRMNIDFDIVEEFLGFRFSKQPDSLLISKTRMFLGARVLETCFAEYRFRSAAMEDAQYVPITVNSRRSRGWLIRMATESGLLADGYSSKKPKFLCCLAAAIYLDQQLNFERSPAWRMFGLEQPKTLEWGDFVREPADLGRFQDSIGYTFGCANLLDRSRTRNVRGRRQESLFRELALIGDKATYTILAEMLPRPLHTRIGRLTTNQYFCEVVRRSGLQQFLIDFNHPNFTDTSKPYADLFEAIIGAALLDGGFAASASIIRKLLGKDLLRAMREQ